MMATLAANVVLSEGMEIMNAVNFPVTGTLEGTTTSMGTVSMVDTRLTISSPLLAVSSASALVHAIRTAGIGLKSRQSCTNSIDMSWAMLNEQKHGSGN